MKACDMKWHDYLVSINAAFMIWTYLIVADIFGIILWILIFETYRAWRKYEHEQGED